MSLYSLIKMFISCCDLYETKKIDDTQKVYVKINDKLIEINHLYFDDNKNLVLEHE